MKKLILAAALLARSASPSALADDAAGFVRDLPSRPMRQLSRASSPRAQPRVECRSELDQSRRCRPRLSLRRTDLVELVGQTDLVELILVELT